MSLIQLGKVILSSGRESEWKLECDQFIEDNLDGLVYLIRHMVGPFSSVEGIPRGGLRLAEALKPFAGSAGPLLIVDDVLTTGASFRRAKDAYRSEFPNRGEPACATVFARGQKMYWCSVLFQMPECFWPESRQR